MMSTERPTTVISSDDIIEDHAIKMGMTYSAAFKLLDFKDVEQEMWARFYDARDRRDDIIVDRTNMRPKSRARFLSETKNHGYHSIAVVFEVPRDELDKRLAAREAATGKAIPKHVVDGMIAGYQEPTNDEVDEILIISYEAA